MNDRMSDRWWTIRLFILMILLSVSCFASGFYQGGSRGYDKGYSDCADFVVALIHEMDEKTGEVVKHK